MNRVQEFWDKQAEDFGTCGGATAPDHHYRLLEINQIISHLGNGGMVLDVGCGNGYSTLKFREDRPDTVFHGIDFAPLMVAAAQKAQGDLDRVNFALGDVRKLKWDNDHFDTVVSERCLINLADWDEQKKAILELIRVTKPGGKLIIVENTIEGLASLNHLRKRFGLREIKQRWHNRYLPHNKFIRFVLENNLKILCEQNIGSFYYVTSRVLYAKMADLEGKEPEYGHIINELAAQCPTMPHYNYSPNMLWVLRKES